MKHFLLGDCHSVDQVLHRDLRLLALAHKVVLDVLQAPRARSAAADGGSPVCEMTNLRRRVAHQHFGRARADNEVAEAR